MLPRFWWVDTIFYRLNSLTGIVLVGLLVIVYLFTNFQLVTGSLQHEVNFIHAMPLLFIEVALWLYIVIHAGFRLV